MKDGKKIGIIIQARMGSVRMPGKVLKEFATKAMIWHVYTRCSKSILADNVIIATSNDKADDELYEYCINNRFDVYRGSLENLLDRFYECASIYDLDQIVRVTGDCPLIDPEVIDYTINYFNKFDVDYCSHVLNRIVPRGLDCEIFSISALAKANKEAINKYDQEHVTPYIINNFSTLPIELPRKYHANFRLTVDEIDDYNLIKEIYKKFYVENKIINIVEVIDYLKNNPDLVSMNKKIKQKHSI